MLKEKENSKELEKLLKNFSPVIGEGLVQLRNVAFENYKKEGYITPLRGFFTIMQEKFVVFQAIDSEHVPKEVKEDSKLYSKLLGEFKKYLESSGLPLQGYIMISEAWVKIVRNGSSEADINMNRSIAGDLETIDTMIFTIDTPDYAFTSVYEKITAGENFVISPEPVQEFFVDKKDPSESKNLVMNNFNFFS